MEALLLKLRGSNGSGSAVAQTQDQSRDTCMMLSPPPLVVYTSYACDSSLMYGVEGAVASLIFELGGLGCIGLEKLLGEVRPLHQSTRTHTTCRCEMTIRNASSSVSHMALFLYFLGCS